MGAISSRARGVRLHRSWDTALAVVAARRGLEGGAGAAIRVGVLELLEREGLLPEGSSVGDPIELDPAAVEGDRARREAKARELLGWWRQFGRDPLRLEVKPSRSAYLDAIELRGGVEVLVIRWAPDGRYLAATDTTKGERVCVPVAEWLGNGGAVEREGFTFGASPELVRAALHAWNVAEALELEGCARTAFDRFSGSPPLAGDGRCDRVEPATMAGNGRNENAPVAAIGSIEARSPAAAVGSGKVPSGAPGIENNQDLEGARPRKRSPPAVLEARKRRHAATRAAVEWLERWRAKGGPAVVLAARSVAKGTRVRALLRSEAPDPGEGPGLWLTIEIPGPDPRWIIATRDWLRHGGVSTFGEARHEVEVAIAADLFEGAARAGVHA